MPCIFAGGYVHCVRPLHLWSTRICLCYALQLRCGALHPNRWLWPKTKVRLKCKRLSGQKYGLSRPLVASHNNFVVARCASMAVQSTAFAHFKCKRLSGLHLWSEWRDLNSRPLGPEPSALPNCATPRKHCDYNLYSNFLQVFCIFGCSLPSKTAIKIQQLTS